MVFFLTLFSGAGSLKSGLYIYKIIKVNLKISLVSFLAVLQVNHKSNNQSRKLLVFIAIITFKD